MQRKVIGKYVIRKGIPIPPRNFGAHRGTAREAVTAMDVGDCIDTDRPANLLRIAAEQGYRMTQRKFEDGKFRLWRIE